MMRLVSVSNALPTYFIVDPSCQFQAGMLAEMTVVGNQVMATVSNGTAPIGIIDDIKTRAFTNVSWNEEVKVPAKGVRRRDGVLVTPFDIKAELRHPYIISNSVISDPVDIILNPVNGIVTFPRGTPLNYDQIGNGVPNAIRTFLNYTYQVPNIPGDDSTKASGRVTVWYNRMFVQVDIFETNQQYPVRANLYCSEQGMFTTRRPSPIHPAIGIVSAPPTPQNPFLELMWY
jgi:hypothetical protein